MTPERVTVSWDRRFRRKTIWSIAYSVKTTGGPGWVEVNGTFMGCVKYIWYRAIRPKLRSGSWRNGNGCPPRVGGRGQG